MQTSEAPELPLETIGEVGSVEYRLRKRLIKVHRSLERLTAATGMLPAEDSGTVSGKELIQCGLFGSNASAPGGDARAKLLTAVKRS